MTPWTTARQASLSNTNSRSPPKPMSIASVMPSNHPILCRALLLPPSIFPSIGVFSNESVLCIRRAKDWSFSFSISPSNEHSGLIPFRQYLWSTVIQYLYFKSRMPGSACKTSGDGAGSTVLYFSRCCTRRLKTVLFVSCACFLCFKYLCEK